MNNTSKFIETRIKNKEFEQMTGNNFMVLETKPFAGKGDLLPGVNLTLLIQEDHAPAGYYGTKKDGSPREGIQFQNVTVTIANGRTEETMKDLHAGDRIALVGFDPEHSYYIDFNLILRYKDYKKLGGSENAEASKNQ